MGWRRAAWVIGLCVAQASGACARGSQAESEPTALEDGEAPAEDGAAVDGPKDGAGTEDGAVTEDLTAPLDVAAGDGGADVAGESAVDAPRDAGTEDAHDAGVDAPRDAGVDAGFDLGMDLPRDVGMDLPRDVGTNVDRGVDGGEDVAPDRGVDVPGRVDLGTDATGGTVCLRSSDCSGRYDCCLITAPLPFGICGCTIPVVGGCAPRGTPGLCR